MAIALLSFFQTAANADDVDAALSIFSVDSDPIVKHGVWRSYGISDGLSSSQINSTVQSPDHTMWFGTGSDGVVQFDGINFRTFNLLDGLSHQAVNDLHFDQSGVLWCATNQGVSLFDGKRFTRFKEESRLLATRIWAIAEDESGVLWFGTAKGLIRHDGSSLSDFFKEQALPSDRVGVISSRNGTLWFGTHNSGVYRFDGEQITLLSQENGLCDNRVTAIAADRKGGVYLGLFDGVYHWLGDVLKATPVIQTESRVHSIYVEPDGTLWAATATEGVHRFDGIEHSTFRAGDGLGDDKVLNIFSDEDGTLWMGTRGSGVSRYSESDRTTYKFEFGDASNRIRAIESDNYGNVWAATNAGLMQFDGTTFRRMTGRVGDGIPQTVQAVHIAADGVVWFGTPRGLFRYDGANVVRYTKSDGLVGNDVRAICENESGVLWVCTGQGVSRIEGTTFTNFTTTEGLAHSDVWDCVIRSDGEIWFATHGGGASRYDGSTFHNLTKNDGLGTNQLTCVHEDRAGTLWLGTNGWGLLRYDGLRFEILNTNNGLSQNIVRSITDDEAGRLWIGTEGGLSCFKDGVFQSQFTDDGLPSNDIRSLYAAKNGDIWVGSHGGGITRIRPSSDTPDISIPDTTTNQHWGRITEISMPTTQPLLAFTLRGISYKTRPGGMLYRYRLAGHNNEWEFSKLPLVEFKNLPTGNYRFEAQAIDRDLNVSAEMAAVDISVHLPWRQFSTWFALGAGGIVVCWQAFRIIRKNRSLVVAQAEILRHQEELVASERLAALGELTATVSHELRNPLGTIRTSHFTINERSRGKGLGVENALDRLGRNVDRCDRIIDELLSYARRTELNRVSIPIDTWLNESLDEISIPADIKLTRKLESGSVASVDPELLRQAIINVVDNACQAMNGQKEGNGSRSLEISTLAGPGLCHIRFTDSGPGIPHELADRVFEPLYSTKNFGVGLGLPIVNRIMERHGGSVDIINGTEGGATVNLSLPVEPPERC